MISLQLTNKRKFKHIMISSTQWPTTNCKKNAYSSIMLVQLMLKHNCEFYHQKKQSSCSQHVIFNPIYAGEHQKYLCS